MKGSRRLGHPRPAVSEVTGTILTIAITLIAGFAVFGYINDQATVSEGQYGQAVAGAVNSVRESFVIIDMSVSQQCTSGVNMWIYNNGEVSLQIVQVLLYDTSNSTNSVQLLAPTPILPQASPTPLHLRVPSGLPSSLCPFTSGHTYLVKVTGLYGDVVSYYTVAP
jgi:flagellin-like protein